MELDCRLGGEKGSLMITLPMAQLARAYMLLDALHKGFLNGFILHDAPRNMVCQQHAAGDVLYDGIGVTLSERSIGYITRRLFEVLLRPNDAAWLHVDIEADGGDVTIRVE